MAHKAGQKICILTQMGYSANAGSTLNAFALASRFVNDYDTDVRVISYGQTYKREVIDGVNYLQLKKRSNSVFLFLLHSLNSVIILSYLFRGYSYIIYGVPHCRVSLLVFSRLLRRRLILRSTMLGDDDLYSIKRNLFVTWYAIKNSTLAYYWAINPQFEKIALDLNYPNVLTVSQGCRFRFDGRLISRNYEKVLSYLSVGHMIYRKGFSDIADVVQKHKLDLTIVGHHDESIPESLSHLREEMSSIRRSLQGFAKLVGPRTDVERFYQECDIFLHFASQEGLPNVVIEAMNFGCVPVVKRLPGIEGYLIEHGINGFLFDSVEDAQQIVSNIENNKYNLEKISLNAINTIKEKFSMSRTSLLILEKLGNV